MFEKIMVCLDGSELAEQILPYAVEEATHFHSKVVLLQVIPDPVLVTPAISGAFVTPVVTPSTPEQMEREQKTASAYLKKVAGTFLDKGLETDHVILQGLASVNIVSYAKENDIGLIAIATHGHGGFGRAVFGSVADYVLRNAGRPILIIRPR